MIIDFLEKFNFSGRLEIFSGEPLIKDSTFQIIEYALEKLPKARILIPTNMTFLFDEDKTQAVEELLHSRRVYLSASVDGKYLQNMNRPHKGGFLFDDEAWNEVFAFAKKWDVGFHPMIYSNGIELWEDNFLWFMDMYDKYGIEKWNLYLLEVRNPEWTRKQCLELEKFMKFLTKYAYDVIAQSSERNLLDFIFKKRGWNILSSPFVRIGRGLGCSIQSTLTIRVGDLAIVPCHRTSYKQFVAGYFTVQDGEIKGIRAHNPYAYTAMMTTSHTMFPYCEQCILRDVCSGGCLGAQYEVFGDPFVPIPSVCMMEFAKYKGIFEGFLEIGVLKTLLNSAHPRKRAAIENFMKVIEDGNRNTVRKN